VIFAFAMTIKKSQGQTFDKVGIYLPQPVFSHGQLFLAYDAKSSALKLTSK
jgi:ATP-dependent exoDNAse (exonuclease V) alpha subunit